MTTVPAAAKPISEAIKTIVVATDFSPDADQALDWAVEVAKVHKARVALVHAVETELPALAAPPLPHGEQVARELSARGKRITDWGLEAIIERHVDRPWIVVPAVAAQVNADVIVLGARGRTNFAGKLLGSTADRIIRTTSIPVVVVRGEPRRPTAIESLLVACDFSEESACAMTSALRLIRAPDRNLRIVLLHIVPLQISFPDPTFPAYGGMARMVTADPEYWREMEQRAAAHLEKFAAPLRSDHWRVEVRTARGLPAEEILNLASEMNAQLIAIGTHGRGGLNRFFLGSVAEWVLHRAQCPVLTARKPDAAASD
jgi:nucleotide-binding universal stress UspA family protein